MTVRLATFSIVFGRIVHLLVKSCLNIVRIILLSFCSGSYDVASNIWQRFKADCSMHFYHPHSAIEVEAKQLTSQHIVIFQEEQVNQFPSVRARGAKILGGQIVVLLAGA